MSAAVPPGMYSVYILHMQWSNALAAMAMLSAKTWVLVPPMTSGFFACNNVSPLEQVNLNAN